MTRSSQGGPDDQIAAEPVGSTPPRRRSLQATPQPRLLNAQELSSAGWVAPLPAGSGTVVLTGGA